VHSAHPAHPAHQGINEIGSSVTDRRPTCLNGPADPTIEVVVVEHQARATSLGFRFLETLLEQQGRPLAVVNGADKGGEEFLADLVALVAIVSSFDARLSGQRRTTRTTATIVWGLSGQDAQVADKQEQEREQEVVADAPG
jgi:predicted site-specific integrase-resolvase